MHLKTTTKGSVWLRLGKNTNPELGQLKQKQKYFSRWVISPLRGNRFGYSQVVWLLKLLAVLLSWADVHKICLQ